MGADQWRWHWWYGLYAYQPLLQARREARSQRQEKPNMKLRNGLFALTHWGQPLDPVTVASDEAARLPICTPASWPQHTSRCARMYTFTYKGDGLPQTRRLKARDFAAAMTLAPQIPEGFRLAEVREGY